MAFIPALVGAGMSIYGKIKKAKAEGKANKENQAAIQKQQSGYDDFTKRFQGYGEEAYNYGKGTRDFADEKYRQMYGELEDGSGGGGGGGIPGYGGEYDQYKDFWDRIGGQGAADADQLNTLRGYGNFKEFANTGGYSDQDKVNYRARALSGTPQLFDAIKNQMMRSGSKGGYTSNFQALSRDKASAMRDAALGAESSLADKIREGRQWGATSGSAAEQQILENMMKGNTEGMSIAERIGNINRAAAASRGASAAGNLADRMRILSEMRELRGETGAEMDYGNMELRGRGASSDLMGMQNQARNANAANAGGIWSSMGSGLMNLGTGGASGALSGLLKKKTAAIPSQRNKYSFDSLAPSR